MTDSQAESHGQPAGSVEWDAVYDAATQVWSGNPNGVLVAEVSGLAPGTVLDVGCGEGADAVWLAQRGWQVTAIDVAATALARAAERAEAAGVGVRFVHAGLLEFSSSGGRFDLVNVQYPGLLHEDGRALAALLDLVAPGGTLLFVHHADLVGEHGDGHHDGAGPAGVDPADYLLPADVLSGLGDGWIVEVFEQRPRRVTEGAGAGHTVDLVLRARRTAAEPAMEAG